MIVSWNTVLNKNRNAKRGWGDSQSKVAFCKEEE